MNTMKADYMTGSYQQTYDRQQEVRARNKERNQKSRRNYPIWDELRLEHYARRMKRREYLRYLHLARAFVSNRKYLEVEQSVRQGNEVNLDFLMDVLEDYGYVPNAAYVERWFK